MERVLPDAQVSETPTADYRFRAEIDRRIVGEKLAATAAAVDYDNFEGSVAEPERQDVYLGVWGLLRKLQR